MTKEQKDKILKVVVEGRNDYARERERLIAEENGKIIGADYMLQRFLDILKTEVEPREVECPFNGCLSVNYDDSDFKEQKHEKNCNTCNNYDKQNGCVSTYDYMCECTDNDYKHWIPYQKGSKGG